jgi:hypothetical protein
MKKGKLLLCVLSTLLACNLTSCTSGTTSSILSSSSSSTSEEESSSIVQEEKIKQIILDNKFQNGFSFSSANGRGLDDGYIPDDRWPMDVDLTYGDATGTISWLGAQHGDIYGLNDVYNKVAGNKPTYENGYYTFKDTSKELSVNPTTGALYLELNTSKEYSRARKSGEQWCHILIEQGFTEPVYVSESKSITLTADLEMKKLENHMGDDYDSSIHTVQYLMYLVIKSENAYDADDFFWFGIPFYDYRYPNGVPESGMIDAGGAGATSKFIYQLPGYDLLPNGLPLNEVQSINIDLKPYIGDALVMCRTKFNKFTNSTIDDLTFQSMNLGFEIPGTFDCGIELSNFGVYVEVE